MKVDYRRDPLFGFEVPLTCPNVPADVLVPEERWPDKAAYKLKYRQLGGLFVENFRKFADDCPPEVVASGPSLNAY